MRKQRLTRKRIILAIVLGFVLTLVSAWVLPLLASYRLTNESPSMHAQAFAAAAAASHAWHSPPTTYHHRHGLGRSTTIVVGTLIGSYEDNSVVLDGYSEPINLSRYHSHDFGLLETGLPMSCFEGRMHRHKGDILEAEWVLRLQNGSVVRSGIIPFKPRPLPFLFNTAFYTVIVIACMLLVDRLGRARWREKHGLCTTCGYDLKGDFNAGCPECGWNRPRG